MPTESELRRRFHDDEPHGSIDLDAVLRRSRARRRPRVVVAAAVSALAVLAIVVPVSISVAARQSATLSAGSASEPDTARAPEGIGGGVSGSTATKPSPAATMNLCARPLATPAPASDGLVLTVQPVDAAAGAREIPVTVTLTNTGAQRVMGSLSPFPTLTLSRDGIVLWHSNGAAPSLAQQVDLAPGASTTFSSTFEPVVCGAEDDAQPSFRADLPEAGPGTYQLSAAMDVTPATTDAGGAVLVTGPTSPVTLH
ncbi:MAG TPA: hypothetical protein VFQ74_05675 [Pseudolysinimonas sp.]|nr:hypothetical protein [Pseudolysinimonas sp.]